MASGRVVQRHALYLGEINDNQQEAWRKTIEIFEDGQPRPRTVALFPEDRIGPVEDADIVRIRLSQLSLDRPRQWGACWLASALWEQLGLDRFWAEHLPPSRKGNVASAMTGAGPQLGPRLNADQPACMWTL